MFISFPFIEITEFKGVFSKIASNLLQGNQLKQAINVDLYNIVGGIGKIKGSRRILNSNYQEAAVTKPISLVGFYNYPDLDGQILRQVLVAAGTTIQKVNSNGTLTSLKTGRTSGLFHVWDKFDEFLLIQNQNPNLIGSGDDPIKYDGHTISNWGVKAPGDAETIAETFDDITDWVTSNATINDETITTKDGSAIKMIQGGASTTARMSKDFGAGGTWAAPTTTENRVEISIYMDPDTYDGLKNTTFCLEIRFSSDSSIPITNNYYSYTFSKSQLDLGWNTLVLDFASAPTGSEGSSAGSLIASAIRTVDIFLYGQLASSGTIAYFDRLVTLERGKPSGTFSGAGAVFSNDATNGIYTYRVTYISKFNLESNAGPGLVMDNRGGGQTYAQVNLTSIPISSDSQVVARKIYRTVGGGGTPLLLTTIEDNTTTVYTDTISDASLGVETPPLAGSTTEDSSPPPKCGIVKSYRKTVFLAGDPFNPTLLYFSEDDEPEKFPLVNTFNFHENITGLFETKLGLVVTTDRGLWRLLGINPNYDIEKVTENIGSVGPRACGTAKTVGWLIDNDGLRTFDLSKLIKVSEVIRDKYEDLSRNYISNIFSVHLSRDNSIVQFNPNSSGNFNSAFMYQYMLDNVAEGFWSELSFPVSINPQDAIEIIDSNGDFRFYVAGGDGMLYEWFYEGSKSWATAFSSEAIVSTIETHYMRLGEAGRANLGQTGRVDPKLIEVSHKGDACTWNATLSSADGIEQPIARDTQSIAFAFGANNSLLRYPVRVDFHSGEFIKILLQNSDLNISSNIFSVKMTFNVRPGQFQVI